MKYRVNEIFRSVSGEHGLIRQGDFATFIRLAGCHLRCAYCDAADAQTVEADNSDQMTVQEIVAECCTGDLELDRVVITGGEPLLQNLTELLEAIPRRTIVQIETSGTILPKNAMSLEAAQCVNHWVVDIKGPSSAEAGKMLSWEDLYIAFVATMAPWVNVTFKAVVDSRQELLWVRDNYITPIRARIAKGQKTLSETLWSLSPLAPLLDGGSLAKYMMEEGMDSYAGVNLQIHKFMGVR